MEATEKKQKVEFDMFSDFNEIPQDAILDNSKIQVNFTFSHEFVIISLQNLNRPHTHLNEALKDNWDDVEGYYSEFMIFGKEVMNKFQEWESVKCWMADTASMASPEQVIFLTFVKV